MPIAVIVAIVWLNNYGKKKGNLMRVFYAEFEGCYPVGALIIAVAPTKKIAMGKINDELKKGGFKKIKMKNIIEVLTNSAYAEILLNGDY